MTQTKMPKAAAAALAELAGEVATRDAQQAQANEAMEKLAPALEKAVETFLESGAGRPLRLRGEAAEAFKTAAAKLDEADKVEHVAKLRTVFDAANQAAESAWAEEDRREADLSVAAQAERVAQQRAEEAQANREKAAELEQWASQFKSSAAQQTEALMRSRAAADVSARAQAALEGASAARVHAEQALSEAKSRTAAAEQAQDAASAALKDPGRVPASMFTMAMDGVRRYSSGERLTPDEEAVVSVLVDTLARKLGIHHTYRNEALEQAEEERRRKLSARPLPPPGAQQPQQRVLPAPGQSAIAPRLFS